MSVFSLNQAEEFIKTGAKAFYHGREIQITPGARDAFAQAGVRIIFKEDAAATATVATAQQPAPTNREALFHSAEAKRIKEEICDIGRRLWQREYVDGNGGNISCRIGPNEIICTPTGVSKGFLKPEMLCMVDLEGHQLAGTWKRTSEITTHLAIYKSTPTAKAVTHAHPVHATAFAMAGVEPPQCLIPEIEVFVGQVPVAPYATPGSPEMAAVIGPMAPSHQSILMGNHGVITWGTSVEDAYFKMEITDAFCRTVVVASHLPTQKTIIPSEKMAELLDLKKKMGLPDSRHHLKPVQLCEVDPWEAMTNCSCSNKAAQPNTSTNASYAEIEAMVQKITDELVSKTNK